MIIAKLNLHNINKTFSLNSIFISILLLIMLIASLMVMPSSSIAAVTPKIEAGNNFTCALQGNSVVKCFGDNGYGQLGYAANSNPNPDATVVDFSGEEVTSITGGNEFLCVLISDGTAKCLGDNSAGQFGNTTNSGTSNPNITPIDVDLPGDNITQISAGEAHTCVLLDTGDVKCFGYNAYGQIGAPANNNDNPTPNTVDLGVDKAIGVATGAYHTCVLLDTGDVKCFGYNWFGEIGNTSGNNDITPNPNPSSVDLGGDKAVSITAGQYFTCAVLENGQVKCWGSNTYGELGNPLNSGTQTPNPDPMLVDLSGDVVSSMTTGSVHACAILSSGSLKCWGNNMGGRLGNIVNSDNNDPNPNAMSVSFGGSKVLAVTAGEAHTCVIIEGGIAKCFGMNYLGQLGTSINSGTSNPNVDPLEIEGLEDMGPSIPPTPPANEKLNVSMTPYNWKSHKYGNKYRLYGYVRVEGTGVNGSTCQGAISSQARITKVYKKKKKSIIKRARLYWNGSECMVKTSAALHVKPNSNHKSSIVRFSLYSSNLVASSSAIRVSL